MKKIFTFLFIPLVVLSADLKTRIQWLTTDPLMGLPKYVSEVPPTFERAYLGKLLFFDKRLSADGTVSCASCHDRTIGFGSTKTLAEGIHGQVGPRKTMPIINRAFSLSQFWDGRALTLEAQATGPIFNPLEMGNTEENLLSTLSKIRGYGVYFEQAFGNSHISLERISQAISDFERTLLSGNSKYDRFQNNPSLVSLTDSEARGLEIFNDRECHICHVAPFFTDEAFHNTGVAFVDGIFKDEGRYAVTSKLGTGKLEELGAFKTPTLRNVSQRGSYMHDGSIKTLEEVIDFYNKGGRKNPHLDPEMLPLGLTVSDKISLIDFLKTLDGEGFEETEPTEFPE